MSKKIVVAKNETRKFSGNELDNGIKYVNIEDKSMSKSYLIVSVNIGCMADPFEYQGLAHFTEHMLFLGSNKYKNEDYIDEFLNKNGGYNNAYTDNFQTVYYISVLDNEFEKSIDILSRFFIDPLFNKDSVNREVNAINSEHMKNIQSDVWRMQHFLNLISKKNSTINKFFTGNLESLNKPNLREEMIKFYKKYYTSSNIMVSTVSSIENKKVSNLINKYFSQVPDKKDKKEKLIMNKPYYTKVQEFFYLKSINNSKNIIYLWEVPVFQEYYWRDLSPYFVIDVINNDSEKSLNQYLIREGLIKSINAYYLDEGKFLINIEINDFNNWNLVDSYLKYFLNKLKEQDWEKISSYQQKRDMLLYNIGTKSDSVDLAQKIANNLHIYSIEECDYATSY